MEKTRRSERLVDLTQNLLSNPNTLFSLSYFSERYNSAKSSISEDIDIIEQIFQTEGIGELVTVTGVSGGVKYRPSISDAEAKASMLEICTSLTNGDRLLPGGYLYMLDIIGYPKWLRQIGRLFASVYGKEDIDAIVTVETKGIPIALTTANLLNVPVIVARKDGKVTEGSVVTINYVSGSSKRIQTMSLAKRALKDRSNVLIIDDFMKAGGTVYGIIELLKEFNANIKGIGVFVEADGVQERLVENYVSLVRLIEVNERERIIKTKLGNYFKEEL